MLFFCLFQIVHVIRRVFVSGATTWREELMAPTPVKIWQHGSGSIRVISSASVVNHACLVNNWNMPVKSCQQCRTHLCFLKLGNGPATCSFSTGQRIPGLSVAFTPSHSNMGVHSFPPRSSKRRKLTKVVSLLVWPMGIPWCTMGKTTWLSRQVLSKPLYRVTCSMGRHKNCRIRRSACRRCLRWSPRF